MKTTYLYIKFHSATQMKYLGKTTKTNVEKYKGSGRHWKRHLQIHGNEVQTIWISQPFNDETHLIKTALQISEYFDVVKSSCWANEKPETGLDGGRVPGFKGRSLNEREKQQISQRMKSHNPMHNSEYRIKHKLKMNSQETLIKKSKSKLGNTNVRGKKWYNDGTVSKMLNECPQGWVAGRLHPHWNHNRKK